MAKKKEKEKTEWEIAKPILQQLYLDGTITNSMNVRKDVWPMRPQFMAVKHNNFHNNFRRMKKTITANKERARTDEAGLRKDMAIHALAKETPGYWDGSHAQRLLKEDIKEKRHEHMKPALLWVSRPQHQEFPLKVFRGHIHQEIRSGRETLHWIVKRKKKKELAKSGKKLNEEDMDCLCDPVSEM